MDRQRSIREVPPTSGACFVGLVVLVGVTLGVSVGRLYHFSVVPGEGGLVQELGKPPWTTLGNPSNRTFRTGRGDCGSWQKDYADLHARIVSGELAPRYAAVHCTRGMADCLKGAMTAFYYAILTDRAFQMYLPHDVQYEWAFGQPNINWTFTDPEAHGFSKSTLFIDVTKKTRAALWDKFESGNITQLGEGYQFVHFNMGWGLSGWMGTNPFIRDRVRALGIRPFTMLGCAMDFLVEPTQEVRNMFKDEIEVLSDVNALKIGLQIRNADLIITNRQVDRVNTTTKSAFFACAEEIERTRAYPGQKVVWYLISDSMNLRRDAIKVYGHKLLTSIDQIRVRHVARIRSWGEDVRTPMLAAAGEMYLYSLADVHIISSRSGYGHVGAMWSRHWHQQYSVEKNKDVRRKCGVHNHEPELPNFY